MRHYHLLSARKLIIKRRKQRVKRKPGLIPRTISAHPAPTSNKQERASRSFRPTSLYTPSVPRRIPKFFTAYIYIYIYAFSLMPPVCMCSVRISACMQPRDKILAALDVCHRGEILRTYRDKTTLNIPSFLLLPPLNFHATPRE